MTLLMTSSDEYDARLAKAKLALDKARVCAAWKTAKESQRPVPCEVGCRYSDGQMKRVLKALSLALERGYIEDAHDGDEWVSDWYRGTGWGIAKSWFVKVYYPSRNKPGSAIWSSGFGILDVIVNRGMRGLVWRPIVPYQDPNEKEETEVQYLLRTETPQEIVCPYCHQTTRLVDSIEIYKGRSYGLAYWCEPCDAYVGCHKGTARSFGSPANEALRDARKEAHKNFDPIWKETDLRRKDAYAWLASRMGMRKWDCHIA